MSVKVMLLRDKMRPGRYLLAYALPGSTIGVEFDGQELEVIQWREARLVMDPEGYAHMCRMSFADWCQRHPEFTG